MKTKQTCLTCRQIREGEDVNDTIKFKHGSKKHILDTYANLIEHKQFEHWIWAALERIANGEDEIEVMMDYGYILRYRQD